MLHGLGRKIVMGTATIAMTVLLLTMAVGSAVAVDNHAPIPNAKPDLTTSKDSSSKQKYQLVPLVPKTANATKTKSTKTSPPKATKQKATKQSNEKSKKKVIVAKSKQSSKASVKKTVSRPTVASQQDDGSLSSRPYSDIIIDARTGLVLHSTDPDRQVYPASLTKMMTLLLAFQAMEAGKLSPSQQLPVSRRAANQPPTRLGLKAGQTISVADALMGLITESANDAAVVVAEALGGSEAGFAIMMTRQAQALGMHHTVFRNASGLPDDEQVTTARDMAVLGYTLIYHYPRLYPNFSAETFTYSTKICNNHNNLMKRYEGMDGIKTGYIRASGFNLVASAVRGKTRLIGVIFGGRSARSRDQQMEQLLDMSFALAPVNSKPRPRQTIAVKGGGGGSDVADGYIDFPVKTAAIFRKTNRAASIQKEVKAYP